MKRRQRLPRSMPHDAMSEGRDHADGVIHHSRWLIGRHDAACPGPRASGVPRSEIKEEAEGRGTFAEGSTRWPVHSPRMNEQNKSKDQK